MRKLEINWNQYASISRQAAAEGTVLLKNDDKVLPIKPGETVSVFGRTQMNYYKSGTGSGGMVNTKYVIGILDALKAHKNISLNNELVTIYEEWIKDHPYNHGIGWAGEPWSQDEMPLTDEVVSRAASISDIAIVIIGRTAGEDKDNSAKKGSYFLTDIEEDMIGKVCTCFKRVAVILNVGNIIDMKWVRTYNPTAVLYAWHGGQEGGNAVVDILTGIVTPCGKLSDTIAYDIEDYPSTPYYGDTKRNFYTEDIYVGYRYFETVAKDKVMYPFGYGLSYTTFSIETISFHFTNDHLKPGNLGDIICEVKITNTGDTKGKEVIQVYSSAPQGCLDKPSRELKSFGKTAELAPGDYEIIKLSIPICSLSSYDDSGKSGNKSCYILEAGTYEIYVGTDIRSSMLAGHLNIPELIVVQRLEEALAPKIAFQRFNVIETTAGMELTNVDVSLRSVNLQQRISEGRPEDIPYTGDKGYKLKDVLEHNVTMNDFLSQLTDDDLIHLSRGEGMSSPKVTPGTAGAYGGVTERLLDFGIPVACCADGPSGIRMDSGAYAFSIPNGTCLACSFNTTLVIDLYAMVGLELRKNRIDTLLGPGLNIHRNPLNGRNFEYFSEDPLLTGKMAAACLIGMNEYGVTGTIKHFACNNQEFKRRLTDSVVSERALREIYLKGFEIAVKEGKACSIMTSYGSINGIWSASNYDLLTTILRKEWGYQGVVMTDWWADMNEDGEDNASRKNTQYMVRAQNDLYMVVENSEKNSNGDLTKESINEGIISRAELIRNAANICNSCMNFPVMDRFLGRLSEEEKIFEENTNTEDDVDFNLVYHIVEDSLCLDLSNLRTQRGSSNLFALTFDKKGYYDIKFKMKSLSGDLAQIPITLFIGGQLLTTITINGTNGQWVEETRDLGLMFHPNTYLKIYFAQGGVDIDEIKISLREELDIEKLRANMAETQEQE
jgi:beta-glucosidase